MQQHITDEQCEELAAPYLEWQRRPLSAWEMEMAAVTGARPEPKLWTADEKRRWRAGRMAAGILAAKAELDQYLDGL